MGLSLTGEGLGSGSNSIDSKEKKKKKDVSSHISAESVRAQAFYMEHSSLSSLFLFLSFSAIISFFFVFPPFFESV